MMILSQTFTAGYGVQPPLYGWLQNLVFEVFGRNILGLAILRFLLLWVTFVFAFLSARRIFEDERKSWAAAMALFTIPQFFWGAQISLTHTVLAAAISSITLYVMLSLLQTGAWRHYLAFGLCVALGTLSKYNYLLLFFALPIAALTIPDFRRRVLNRRLPLCFVLTLLLLAPHVFWLSTNIDVAFSQTDKFKLADGSGFLETSATGAIAVLRAFASYLGLSAALFTAIAFVPLRGRTRQTDTRPRKNDETDSRLYILRVLAIATIIVFCAVIISQATRVNERWLHPLFFMAPLGFLILLERRLSPPRLSILTVFSAGLAISSIVGLVVMHFFPQIGSEPRRALSPFPALATQITKLGFEDGYILASNTHIAGNLSLRFPESRAAEPRYGLWPRERLDVPGKLLLAWQGEQVPPSPLIELWQKLCGAEIAPVSISDIRQITAPYERSSVPYALNIAIVPLCQPQVSF